tara:strand:- start:671 stop:1435 length:765 start_codon:yes stop_codon:yes gene_type:complete
MTTQLEKDVASNAGVIPIWPWLKDGKPKDCLPPNIYANMLLQAKIADGQVGAIIRCDHDNCEPTPSGIGTKSMFWRSNETPENIVPEGWIDFGSPNHFSECPLCRARDIEDIGLDPFMEDGREEQRITQGSTGGPPSDKPLRPLPVSPPIPTTTNTINLCPGNLKDRARELFKNHPEHLEAALKEIDNEERKKRANVAEKRKRNNADEAYFNSKKRSKTKGGNRRRKKRTKKRRKLRRRKRTKKRRKSRRRKRR